jgi:putative ATPase
MTRDLFAEAAAELEASTPGAEPLAARMRPRTLEEFVGQEAILGRGRLLRRLIERDELRSAIFWGPPGCGKSTLASLIARRTRAHFEPFSAVTGGVADVRRAIDAARTRRRAQGRRTILFVDEIHRFNKAQQDAFLPHVEDGTILLIGATTENPFFSINGPLLSRTRLFRFVPLADDDVRTLIRRAVADPEQGLGALRVMLDPEAEVHLVDVADGDARGALSALELAALSAEPDASGERRITREVAQEATQGRALAYDRDGDQHFDAVSAFIKSLRGSDPDAALYWMARMIAAGEDPRFIARRMVIHAAEDVGLADPTALLVANAAAHAVEYVGLPEAQIPMAQAAIYIAVAPKSNAVVTAIGRATEDVAARRPPPVPVHLRDSHYPGAKALGHGEGYRYPHDFPGHVVEQEYLPKGAQSRAYYVPSENGFEAEIRGRAADGRVRLRPSEPNPQSPPYPRGEGEPGGRRHKRFDPTMNGEK